MKTTVELCPDAKPFAGVLPTSGDPSSLLVSDTEAAEMLACLPLVLRYASQAIGDCGVLPAWTVSPLACTVLGAAPGAAFTASSGSAFPIWGPNLFAFIGADGDQQHRTYPLLKALTQPFADRVVSGYGWMAGYPAYSHIAPIMYRTRSRNGSAILLSDFFGGSSNWNSRKEDEDFFCSLYDGEPLARGGYDLGWRPVGSAASRLLVPAMLSMYGSRRAQVSPLLTRTLPVLCATSTTTESIQPNPALLETYHDRIQELFACRHRQFHVVFERDGAVLLRNYASECLREIGDSKNYSMLRFAHQAARLALVFHLAKHGPGAAAHALSPETVAAAIRYMQGLGRHVLAVYRYAAACQTAMDDQAIVATLKLLGRKGATAWSIARKAAEPELPFIFQRRFRSEDAAAEALLSAAQRNLIVAGKNERFSLP